jgi:predicted lipoprotein with Yx(FWY)xxD motif
MADELAQKTPPQTPVEISVYIEGGRFVFRTDEPLAIYTNDKDAPGKSACEGECLKAWHPVVAPKPNKVVGDWTSIQRADQSWQWAYKGKPVYTYALDAPGKINGDGVAGLWHVLNP